MELGPMQLLGISLFMHGATLMGLVLIMTMLAAIRDVLDCKDDNDA